MRPWFAFLLLLLVLAPASRATAGTRLRAPSGVVHAGDSFEVRWEGLPEQVHEAELEMSLDDGRWVRISPEIHSLEGSYRWTIPNTPAERVRIRLRCGGEHREEVAAVSSEFRIESDVLEAGGIDFLGEWWSALDDSAARSAQTSELESNQPVYSALELHLAAEPPPSAPQAIEPSTPGERLPGTVHVTLGAFTSAARSSRPAFVPLRN